MKKRTLSMEGFASSLYQNLMEKSMKRNGKAFAYLFLAVWSMTSIVVRLRVRKNELSGDSR